MSFAACTPVSSGSGFLKSSLSYLDCAGQAIGSMGYTALTQPGSVISQLVLAAITLFIAFHGVRMMFGRTVDMGDALLAVAKIGLVLMLVTSWPAVRTLFAQPSFAGPAELVDETRLQGPVSLVDRLGRADDGMVTLTKWGTGKLDIRAGRMAGGQPAASEFAGVALTDNFALGLGRLSFLIGAMMSLGLLKLLGGIMIAALPIFAGLLLFDATRSLFWGWLRLILGLFVAGFAVPLLLTVELSLIEPWLGRAIQERSAFLATPSAPTELLAMSGSFLLILIGSMALIAKSCFAVDVAGIMGRSAAFHQQAAGETEVAARQAVRETPETTRLTRAENLAMTIGRIDHLPRGAAPAPVSLGGPQPANDREAVGTSRPSSRLIGQRARQRMALSHARRNQK